jgi:hypothetical protein
MQHIEVTYSLVHHPATSQSSTITIAYQYNTEITYVLFHHSSPSQLHTSITACQYQIQNYLHPIHHSALHQPSTIATAYQYNTQRWLTYYPTTHQPVNYCNNLSIASIESLTGYSTIQRLVSHLSLWQLVNISAGLLTAYSAIQRLVSYIPACQYQIQDHLHSIPPSST